MHCFILAGGFATRLWPLTERRAKPLLPLAGKPLLTHLAEKVPADIPITVSTNAIFADDMRQWAKTINGRKVEVRVEDAGHDDHKVGALGAIALWIREESIHDDVLLLAGDNYVSFDIGAFTQLFSGNPLLAAFDVKDLDTAKSFGTVILSDEKKENGLMTVNAFEEKPANPRSSCVSTGCYVLPASSLPILCDFAVSHPDNIGGVFEEFLRHKLTIDCFVFTDAWKDIGSYLAYMALHKEVVGTQHFIDPSSSIDKDTSLTGAIAIGPKTSVVTSTIEDSILFGSSTIEDCIIRECIIDEGCTLKGVDLTGKMLRRGTVLKK